MTVTPSDLWAYESWPPAPKNWDDGTWQEVWTAGTGSERVRHEPWCDTDYHLDLGCGRLKKGRIGVDKFSDPGVNVVMDLDSGWVRSLAVRPGEDARAVASPTPWAWTNSAVALHRGLPFPDGSIQSVVSHHALEHIGAGFLPLLDEVYRVLEPDGVLYAITPLFPSRSAVDDPTHQRLFTVETWRSFCGYPPTGEGENPSGCWLDSFSTPYTNARFELIEQHADPLKPPEEQWGPDDVRELRVVLRAVKSR